MTRRRVAIGVLVSVLALAGCSGSDTAPSPTDSAGGRDLGDVDQVPGQVVHADSGAISPDGSRFVAGCRDDLCLWDTADGELTTPYAGGSLVAWSPDGSLIATDGRSGDGSQATIDLVDATDGTVVRTLSGHTADAANDAVGGGITDLVFSTDGTTLVSTAHDGTVRLWQVSDGTETGALDTVSQDPDEVAVSPDGARLVVASPDEPVELWDLAAARRVATVGEQPQGDVAWSPDGRTIATASRTADAAATVRLWDADSLVQTGGFPGGVQAYRLAFSPDGSTVAMSQKDEDVVLLWSLEGGKTEDLSGHDDQPRAVVWSPDGDVLYSVSSGEGVLAWDPRTGALERSFEVPAG